MVAMVTSAFVGAVQIDTAAVEADSRKHALVHIWGEETKEEKGCLRKFRQLSFHRP